MPGGAQPPRPGPGGPKRPPLPSNAKTQSEYALQELKKTAASRGITVEQLVAQMVAQYLKEDKDEKPD
jgi:hypothetical protein